MPREFDQAAARRYLARADWRRRKGRYARRHVTSIVVAVYRVAASAFIANTSCQTLLNGHGSVATSVPTPT